MKYIKLLFSFLVFVALISACSPAEVAVQEPEVATDEIVLTVGGQGYTRADLEAFNATLTDYTNKDGETSTYSGVSLTALLEDSGVSGTGTLVFTAADGYEADLLLEEALACSDCIVAFDGDSHRMVMPELSSKLQVRDVVEISVN